MLEKPKPVMWLVRRVTPIKPEQEIIDDVLQDQCSLFKRSLLIALAPVISKNITVGQELTEENFYWVIRREIKQLNSYALMSRAIQKGKRRVKSNLKFGLVIVFCVAWVTFEQIVFIRWKELLYQSLKECIIHLKLVVIHWFYSYSS